MVLPPYDVEVIRCGIASSLGAVHMDGRGKCVIVDSNVNRLLYCPGYDEVQQ